MVGRGLGWAGLALLVLRMSICPPDRVLPLSLTVGFGQGFLSLLEASLSQFQNGKAEGPSGQSDPCPRRVRGKGGGGEEGGLTQVLVPGLDLRVGEVERGCELHAVLHACGYFCRSKLRLPAVPAGGR